MISPRMQDALNKQTNAELYSSYLYLAMAGHFEAANLPGFGNWLRVQAREEYGHGMRLFDFILQRGGQVKLEALAGPPAAWGSPLAAFEEVCKHEAKITALIGQLVELAAAEKDHAAGVFLQWFVNEQVEEEASAAQIAQMLRMIGDSKNGLFMVDHNLSKRKAE